MRRQTGLAINPFNPLAGRVDGLTLGRSILPVEWIHPIQNGWIDDGLIHVDSAHVKSYLSSAFDFCCPSGAENR